MNVVGVQIPNLVMNNWHSCNCSPKKFVSIHATFKVAKIVDALTWSAHSTKLALESVAKRQRG